jgi:hypothetical protein
MDDETNENRSEESQFTPPRFFQHVDLFRTFEETKAIDQKKLINMINHLHFTCTPLFILLKHPVYQNSLLVKAHPEPCLGNQLTCRWDDSYFQYKLNSHNPICVIITNNSFMTIASFNLLHSNNKSFTIKLPDKSYALNQRQFQRHPCRDIRTELIQSDFIATGDLIDFSSTAFRIKVDSETPEHNCWFNPDAPASVRFFCNEKLIYSEFCRCIRQQNGHNLSEEIVFTLENQHKSRFTAKKIRNPRRLLSPPLSVVFMHPFFKKRTQRDIYDISTTGFSIFDKPDDDVFMPGMIIPALSILLAGIPIAKCSVQVIYRQADENNIRYGVAILDMDIHSFSRINHILGINSDSKISVSTVLDTDALWDFFFQAGFIYPEKYSFCQAHREKFIEIYRKLYQERPEIARHFTYEQNGRIYGHISMIRAYERTWLIQHHASLSLDKKLAGFIVLRHIMLFANGMYQLSSAQMDYSICYFRPENKFPDRVFGGFARDFNNRKACSLDLFAYMTLPVTPIENELPHEWILRESTAFDLWEIEQFYKHHSGGLLLDILHLGTSNLGNESLEKVFKNIGLLRKCRSYSLTHLDHLKAVFIVDQSDLAINMSNLLNCIKVLTTDPSGLPQELLSIAVSILGGVYNLDKATILLYPASSFETTGISCEKRYQLWILNMRYMNQFMDYVQKRFRMKYI